MCADLLFDHSVCVCVCVCNLCFYARCLYLGHCKRCAMLSLGVTAVPPVLPSAASAQYRHRDEGSIAFRPVGIAPAAKSHTQSLVPGGHVAVAIVTNAFRSSVGTVMICRSRLSLVVCFDAPLVTPAASDQAPYQAPYQNTSPGLLARFRAGGALYRWWGAPRH